jgi:hypothetical protein
LARSEESKLLGAGIFYEQRKEGEGSFAACDWNFVIKVTRTEVEWNEI